MENASILATSRPPPAGNHTTRHIQHMKLFLLPHPHTHRLFKGQCEIDFGEAMKRQKQGRKRGIREDVKRKDVKEKVWRKEKKRTDIVYAPERWLIPTSCVCVCVCVPAGRCPFNRLLWEVEALIKQDYVFPSVHQFPAAQSLPHTHTLPLLFCTYKHRMPSNYPQTEASTSYCHVIIHTLFHCLLSSHRHTCDPMSWGLLK